MSWQIYPVTGNGKKYKAVVRLPGIPARTRRFDTKREAKSWAKETEGNMVGSKPAVRQSVAACIDLYLRDKCGFRLNGHSPVEAHEKHLAGDASFEVAPGDEPARDTKTVVALADFWFHKIGQVRVPDLQRADITDVIDEYRATRINGRLPAPATVGKRVASIKAILAVAIDRGWADVNVAKGIKAAASAERVRYLRFEDGHDELQRFMTALDDEKTSTTLRALVLVAITTGLRQGNIVGIRHDDLDRKTGELVIPETKNGAAHSHRLDEDTLAAVKAVPRVVGSPWVFASRTEPYKHVWWPWKEWKDLLDRAGIPAGRNVEDGFVPHDLRHTAASFVLREGGTLAEAGDLLGHRSLVSTKRYAHLDTGSRGRQSAKIARLIRS